MKVRPRTGIQQAHLLRRPNADYEAAMTVGGIMLVCSIAGTLMGDLTLGLVFLLFGITWLFFAHATLKGDKRG